MTQEEMVSYIESIPRFTEKHSLAHTRRFLEVLGNPDRAYPSIHVAGTNGKGSVCAFLASICKEARMRVGLFTSPHLSDLRERIQVDGEKIPGEAFSRAFLRVCKAAKKLEKEGLSHPSYFEFLYLLASSYFAEAKPDVVLLETGLGGRLDATNTLENPLVTIITSVSLDHMQYLGNTIPEIAAEKAGIIKPKVPVVAFLENPEVARVIRARAEEVGAPLKAVTRADILLNNASVTGQGVTCHELFLNRASGIDFSVRSGYDSRQIRLRLPGAALFQTENAALAVRTAEVLWEEAGLFPSSEVLESQSPGIYRDGSPFPQKLSDRTQVRPGWSLERQLRFDTLLREGVWKMRWPCRMEEVFPDVFLDGAHNEDGIVRFSESMERILSANGGRRRFVLLFGAVKDKDYSSMIQRLAALRPAFVIVTEVSGSRRASAEEFAAAFAENGVFKTHVIKDAREAFAKALEEKKDGVAGICGSLYLAGRIREVCHDQL